MFEIADGLQIEAVKVVGKKIAVLGKSGSGKTNTLFAWCQQWFRNRWPLTVIDPMGQYSQLKEDWPIIIAGRGEVDIELTERNAAALAEFSFQNRVSVVLEMFLYPDAEEIAILDLYISRLWELISRQPKGARLAYGLIIDEAQLYLPQGKVTLLSQNIKQVAKMGRHFSLTTVVASQRAASIDKDFLTQANLLIAHQLFLGVDTAVLNESLPLPKKELNALMRKLGTGEALVIGDRAMIGDDDYLRVQVRDASLPVLAAPDPGEGDALPVIDDDLLAKLGEIMTSPPPSPDAGEMVETLQQKIASLQQELQAQPKVEVQRVEVPVIDDSQIEQLKTLAQDMMSQARELMAFGQEIMTLVGQVQPKASPAMGRATHASPLQRPVDVRPIEVKAIEPDENGEEDGDETYRPRPGALKVLTAIVQRHPMKLTRSQVALFSKYTVDGGSFTSYFSELKRAGMIVEVNGETTATGDGIALVGVVPSLPQTTDELLAMWQQALRPGSAKILGVLVDNYPEWISRDDIAAIAGYTASGGSFTSYLSDLRRNGLMVEDQDKYARAADALFMMEGVR